MLRAAAERHREAVRSMQQPGRPEAGQHVAVKVVGRAVHLVSFALKRAADAGVPFERLVELTAWEPDLVREGLARRFPSRGLSLAWRRRESTLTQSRKPQPPSRRFTASTNSRNACSPTATSAPALTRGRRWPRPIWTI